MMKIPKKAAKPLLEEISTSSVQYKNEIQRDIILSFRTVNASEIFFKHVFLVNNESLSAKFNARRQKMTNKQEDIVYVRVNTLERAKEIAGTGVPVSSELSSDPPMALGNPAMGVYCSKYIDYSSNQQILSPGEECVLIMCKALKGKSKAIAESEVMIDPTFDYDSHVSKSAGTSGGLVSSIRDYHTFFLANQIYVYEYTDTETERYPSSVLPFAILNFTREFIDFSSVSTSTFTPIKSLSVTCQNPSLRPLKPLIIWSGNVVSVCAQASASSDESKGTPATLQFSEAAALVSFFSRVNPLKLSDNRLEIIGWFDVENLQHYFAGNLFPSPPAVSGISQIVQDDANSSVFYAYFQILSKTQVQEISSNVDHVPSTSFSEYFKNALHISKVAVSKIKESYLYIFSAGEHANRIGITNKLYNPPVLHCIYVSSTAIYNLTSYCKSSTSGSSEYTMNVGPDPKRQKLEMRAFNMSEPSTEVQNVTTKLCNFGIAINQAENNTLTVESYFPCDVISNKFDLSYYSNDPNDIPVESVSHVDRTITNAAKMQAYQEKQLEERLQAQKQRELDEMRAQLGSITQAHSQSVEQQLASKQQSVVINTFALPREGALARSFKKKNNDPASMVNKVRRPTNPPVRRESILSSRSQPNERRNAAEEQWRQQRAEEMQRVNQAMPLYDSSANKNEKDGANSSRSGSRHSSPSPPPIMPVSNPLYNRKGGGLLDMPLPPTLPRATHRPPPPPRDPEMEDISDMEISNSPEDNNNLGGSNARGPRSKYMKSSNGQPVAGASVRDRDRDDSPEAPAILIDSPVKPSGELLGSLKRPRKSESDDDHPTLDGSAAPGTRNSANRNDPMASRTSQSSVKQEVADPMGSRRHSDINLAGKSSNLPEAPYARPERPHFKVEDGKSDRRKAFVVDDRSIPKESDFKMRTVGQLTEYSEDKNDYRSSTSSSRPPPNNANANRGQTILTNQLGQRVDINSSSGDVSRYYKPPPSWRPEDPAEMCKNLTVSFFKSKLNRLGRPQRDLNTPRFKGYRFERDYRPDNELIYRLDRMIHQSEDRAEARRKEEERLRDRIERDMGIGSSETAEVSTENEMRLLQKRLGRELRNDEWDEQESRFLKDMLDMNLGIWPQSESGGRYSGGGYQPERGRINNKRSYDREPNRNRQDRR